MPTGGPTTPAGISQMETDITTQLNGLPNIGAGGVTVTVAAYDVLTGYEGAIVTITFVGR